MKKNIVIIILSILVLGLGGYLVYDKVIDKEETNANNKNEEIVEQQDDKEIYATMARKYIDDVIDIGIYDVLGQLSKYGLDENIKTLMAIYNVQVKNECLCQDAFDIDPNTREYFSERLICSENDPVYLFDYDSVNIAYKKLFGTSANAVKTNVSNVRPYEYSDKANGYVELSSGISAKHSLFYYDIEEVEATDSKLKIKFSYLTYHYSNMTTASNRSNSFSYYIGETLYENKTKEEVIKSYNENKKSLPNLTFNYEKEDGRYILKSVE